jgi:hypothetical protein
MIKTWQSHVPFGADSFAVETAMQAEIDECRAKLALFNPDWANYQQGKEDAFAEFSKEPVAWMVTATDWPTMLQRSKPVMVGPEETVTPLYTKNAL